jgi:outer membrane receptor protein involved in Fe transport
MLNKLPHCLSIGLLALAINTTASAQDSAPAPQPEETKDDAAREKKSESEGAANLEEILVTGSLIPREPNEGISPITVVSDQDMKDKGLMSIGEVMDSLTENSGYTEGRESNLLGRFTTGGQEVNIRGFGTGRTLILLNGRRIADYPLPFGGEQNGVDVGAIPMSSLARVELLSSGASAIYGSDAIGGVLNFITKRDMDQTQASITGGTFQQGVGQTLMASVITGNSYERGSFTFGLDGFVTEQILASDVDYLKEHAPYNAGMVSIQRNTPPAPVVPVVPPDSCAPLGFEFTDEMCLSEVSDTISLQPDIRQMSVFFDGRFDLTDNVELTATALFTDNVYDTRSNVLFWNGVVVNEDADSAVFLQRGFSADELGTSDVEASQRMWTATFGAKGGFDVGDDQWHWDVSYSHADYRTTETSINLKEEGIRDWIMNGAETVITDANQQYTYFVDNDFYDNQLIDNIVRPVQQGDLDGLIGNNVMHANASSSFLTLTVDGTLGDWGFLYKPAKFALRSEIASQTTEIIPDERSLNTDGEGWYNIGAIQSKGTRDRKALALELALPVHSRLDLSLAGRLDHYSDSSAISSRPSGQIKFLYRPNDWIKFRGGYSQTFRAPDMFNLYGESDAFATVADFSAPGCFDGEVYVCGFSSIATTRRPDTGLSEEHGNDVGFGVIWQPVLNFVTTLDWYRINLEDLVVTESAYDLLLREWQCNNGELEGSSQLCADVRARITRNGFGAVEHVTVQPINQDSMEREGVDLRANYSFESEKYGQFTAQLSYSKILKFELNSFEGDESIDLKYGWQGQSTPENSTSLFLGWMNPLTTGKAIGLNLYVQRDGGVYNFSQTQFLKPMYKVNLTAQYQFNARGTVGLTLNNLLYTSPQDNGSGIWPDYWAHLDNGRALGRSAYLSMSYSFD